jgi:hypothetical protein
LDEFRRLVQGTKRDYSMADRRIEMARLQQPLACVTGIEGGKDVVACASTEEIEVLVFFIVGKW